MRERILQAMDFLVDARRFRLRLFGEGIVIGVFTGLVIAAFRWLLEESEVWRQSLYPLFSGAPWGCFFGYFLVLAVLAAILYGIVHQEPMSSGSGIPQIKGILLGRMQMRWARVLVYKFIGGVLAIGAGLSLGREGPSVQLGAAIGQGISRSAQRSRAEERFLLTAGAGAGLAAAFNAPLAGVIFCLEELQKNFSPLVLMATVAAAVTATAVTQFFFGGAPVFHMGTLPVLPMQSYGLLVLLGLLVGFLGEGFNRVLLYALDAYDRSPLSGILRPFFPLAWAGLLGFVLPEILGGGNRLVDALVAEHFSLLFLCILLAGKFLFTMVSFGSGVPGGIFLPMLVLGALCGAILSKLAVFWGFLDAAYAPNLIVFGMAAYFSAVVKSPVTGSILIMEMTGSFQHMLALIVVSMTAYLVADLLQGKPVYDLLLQRSLAMQMRLKKAIRHRRVVVEFSVGSGSRLDGVRIDEAPWPKHCLLIQIKRGETEIVPEAAVCLQAGDYLYILTDDAEVAPLQALSTECFHG